MVPILFKTFTKSHIFVRGSSVNWLHIENHVQIHGYFSSSPIHGIETVNANQRSWSSFCTNHVTMNTMFVRQQSKTFAQMNIVEDRVNVLRRCDVLSIFDRQSRHFWRHRYRQCFHLVLKGHLSAGELTRDGLLLNFVGFRLELSVLTAFLS